MWRVVLESIMDRSEWRVDIPKSANPETVQ